MVFKSFPQDKFSFRLYDNINLKTWQQIKKETGCYGLINLAYFNMTTYEHDDAIMFAGKWARTPAWHYYGIHIDQNGVLTVGPETEAKYDYANAEPIYYLNDQVFDGSQHYGKQGLTIIGVKPDNSVAIILVSKDEGMTTTEACQILRNVGCTDILRFDGSWSSQGSLGPGMDVIPSKKRIVRSYMLIFERKDNDKEMNTDSGIVQKFMTNNRCYTNPTIITPKGIVVHSTGTPGFMAENLQYRWDSPSKEVSVHGIVDDENTLQVLPWEYKAWHCAGTANNTHLSFEICEPIETRLIDINWIAQKRNNVSGNIIPWAITRIQEELVARGYNPNGIDGKFGPGCEAAVKAFQFDNGLAVDGSVGKKTLKALANRPGSKLAYDPAECSEYFDAVYNRAKALCVYLCNKFSLPASTIICHSEAYALGIGNNHADVMHWFPLHGKTMDDFRNEVADILNSTDPFRYAVEVLKNSGIIKDPEYWTGNNEYETKKVRDLIVDTSDKIGG